MATKHRRGMRKLPRFIKTRLSTVGNDFFVAVVKRVPLSEIQSGAYSHTGLNWIGGQLDVTELPLPTEHGRFTNLNIAGQIIVRRDLAKIDKTITFINPRLFGIAGNRCRITQVRRVFQRDHLAARRLAVVATVFLLNEKDCIVRFTVDRIFSSTEPNIDRELLFALNLLHECVGGVNVFSEDATTQDYLGSIQVHWEILPSGNREDNIRLILGAFRPKTAGEQADLEQRANERYDFFETLNPKHIIRGTGGLNGYMGAVIGDNVVVFEHLTPGNGIYLLFEDWASQSQRTKTDLLAHGEEGKDYIRITHTGDWQLRVHNAIASRIQ